MEQALTVVKTELGRGGALCKEFNRVRQTENQNWKVEQHFMLAAMELNQQLASCTPESVGRALIDLAMLGVSLSPALKQAYAIPYKVKLPGGAEENRASISLSYMGLEQIAYRTGFVNLIQCVLVYDGDEFKVWTDDDGRHIYHVESSGKRTRVTHAYCIAKFTSGAQHVEVMDWEDIKACEDAATKQNNNETPWAWRGKFKGEMYKKCPLRRGWKHWPKVDSPALLAMMDAVNRTDPMDFGKPNDPSVVSTVENANLKTVEVIGETEIRELAQLVRTAGMVERGIDPWLQALAVSFSYQGRGAIRKVLKTDFEDVKLALEEGLEQWKAQRSDSEPEGSTAPQAAT